MSEAPCHLCRRAFPAETMFVDRDGDFWCYADDCHAIARERMMNPRAPHRVRREVARLEFLYAPVDPMALFELASPAEIFGITDEATRPPVEVARPPRVLGEQLSLLSGEAIV